ncbi:MAG: SDR family oxidoreductase [Rubrivivax sp.]|nr:SDR family oxidoreductase [Rubrivivax sp.]
MDLELGGKHVLVTGGSRGIGLACVRAFAAEGARVSLVARDAARLDAAVAALADDGHRTRGWACDLTDASAAAAMVDSVWREAGPVDVLVNSAGAARRTPFDELTPQAWHDAMQAKFFAYIHVMDPLVKRMGARGSGAIVNVVGLGGKVATTTHLAGGSANAALMLASAGLANAYAPRGVRINAVNPGLTQTERLNEGIAAEARAQGVAPEEVLRRHHERLPLRRIAQPEEIASVVVFLASARASHVTGAVLSLDGASVPMVV